VQHLEASFSFSAEQCPITSRQRQSSALLYQETPDFIPPAVLPPNLQELNPVDYTVWRVLQEQVYRTKVSDLDDLKMTEITNQERVDHSESHG